MAGPSFILGFTLWVLGLIGERISGAHINPAITLVYALRKENRLENVGMVILYIVVQFIGGLGAGFLGWWINPIFDWIGPVIYNDYLEDNYYIGQAIFV